MVTESNAVTDLPVEDQKSDSIPISPEVEGRERIRVMLLARGYELKEWAEAQDPPILPSQLSMLLARSRAYPEIRDRLARTLELTRSQFDAILPLPEAA